MSFQVRAGEIVGIAGVAGNGQSELLESHLRHARPAKSGTMRLNGEAAVAAKATTARPRCARKGLAHVPEDRLRMGLVTTF